MEHFYLCIDLKCFYASVECVDRGWDPFKKLMVVADPSRGPKTICLAVSPAMKKLGVRSRCRVFQIPKSIDYEKTRPRMRRYMEVSAKIYALYLRYFSPDDIHVYSVDECFIDVGPYLALYDKTPRKLACDLMKLVLEKTGICATAGMGPSLFLAKVALDVTAKHVDDHIGYLDEDEFKLRIWRHRPLTDIWGIGPGIARRLKNMGVYDLAGVVLADKDALYQEFGVNAELLIDHAWGVEPCTIAQIHAYRPQARSICNAQVLPCDYDYDEARLVLREMVDASALDLVEKGLVCEHISLFLGYAAERPSEDGGPGPAASPTFTGEHGTRRLGHDLPHAGGSRKLKARTNARAELTESFLRLYDQAADRNRALRRISLSMGELVPEEFANLTLFTDAKARQADHRLSEATLAVKQRFGKNALVRGMSLRDKATARERNAQVGGHHE